MPLAGYEMSYESTHQGERYRRDVARNAFELWDKAGRPMGNRPDGMSWADHFWFRAEAMLFEDAFQEQLLRI